MALVNVPVGSSGGSGDRLPVFKYDAKAGRMILMDRAEKDGVWTTTKRDITMSDPKFTVDFGSAEVGWLLFPRGAAPVMITVPAGQPLPMEPAAQGTKKKDDGRDVPNRFAQGLRLKVAGSALKAPDGSMVREFASNAKVVLESLNKLHDLFEAAPEARAGKIPVVRVREVIPVQAGQSSNYQPDFEVVTWIDRDEKLMGPRTVPMPGGASMPAGLSVATPQPAVAPAPVPITQTLPAEVAADDLPY